MRGRKIDTEFLSSFISECIKNNKASSEEILKEAKDKINLIDNKIKEAENLKSIRSKLLDVIITFEKPVKKDEIKTLSFLKIQNTDICKFICDNISKPSTIKSFYNKGYLVTDIIFCIKQLLEHKIISKSGDYLLKGENFQEYLETIS